MKVNHFDSSCFSAKRLPSSCHLDVAMEPLLDPICADESSHEGLELKCQQTTRFFKEMEKAVSLFSLMEALNLSRKWPFKFETMSFLFLCNAIISQNFFLGVHLPQSLAEMPHFSKQTYLLRNPLVSTFSNHFRLTFITFLTFCIDNEFQLPSNNILKRVDAHS